MQKIYVLNGKLQRAIWRATQAATSTEKAIQRSVNLLRAVNSKLTVAHKEDDTSNSNKN